MKHTFACGLLIAMLSAGAVTASQAQRQTAEVHASLSGRDREAQKVLKLVVAKEPPPQRCRYGTDWERRKLDAHEKRLAHVGAEFASPSTTGDFRALIDPDNHVDANVFCTNVEVKSYTAERIAEFEAGSEHSMQIDRTLFGYPIFNQSRTKSIVVVTHFALDGRFRSLGRIGRHPGGVAVVAQEYRKVGGRWRYRQSYELGIS